MIKSFNIQEEEATNILVVGTLIDYTAKKTANGQYYKLQLYHAIDGVINGKVYSNGFDKNLFKKGENIVLLVKKRNNEFIVSKSKSFHDWKTFADRKLLSLENKINEAV
jgi:hypothetical protein